MLILYTQCMELCVLTQAPSIFGYSISNHMEVTHCSINRRWHFDPLDTTNCCCQQVDFHNKINVEVHTTESSLLTNLMIQEYKIVRLQKVTKILQQKQLKLYLNVLAVGIPKTAHETYLFSYNIALRRKVPNLTITCLTFQLLND